MNPFASNLSSADLSRAIFDYSPHMVTVTDVEGCCIAINPAAETVLGITASLALGRHVGEILPQELAEQCLLEDARVLEMEDALVFEQAYWVANELRTFETAKFPVFDEDGCLLGVCALSTDVTARRRAEEAAQHNANYDPLTDLPNRALFVDRLRQALNAAKRADTSVGVLYIDLDNFGAVNDAFGDSAGDHLLVESAWRLASCVRTTDTVARLSGDEFGIILSSLEHGDDAELVARKIMAALAPPVVVDDHELFASASIGIAVSPADANAVEDLLRHAAIAMHRAKRRGRGCIRRFSRDLSEAMTRRQQIEAQLKRAVEREELFLVYQPLVAADTRVVIAAEALLRWQSPTMGLVSPAHFIPVAEETGLINEIGWYVLRKACADAVEWNSGRRQPIALSVNVAPQQLLNEAFVETVVGVLQETGLPAHLLKLEITESGLLENIERCRSIFVALRALGIQLSLDDFGTGYSALGYLQKFEFDVLKLDRSFIHDIVDGSEQVQVAESILHMAKRLGLKVVAEGVENAAQVAFLSANGCELIQGFYFSKPRTMADFTSYLSAEEAETQAAA